MPEELPDLTNHNSFFSEVMKENPALYAQLKDKKTSLGVTLGHCIKTGIDNPGTAPNHEKNFIRVLRTRTPGLMPISFV